MARRRRSGTPGQYPRLKSRYPQLGEALERAYDMYEQAGRHGEGNHSLADIAQGLGSPGMRGRGRGRGDLGGPGSPRASIVGAVASLAASSPAGGALSRSVGAPIPSGFGPNQTPFGASMGGGGGGGGGISQGAAPMVLTPPTVMRPIKNR